MTGVDLSTRTRVLVVVEQLRRRVPGGSGTYIAGLLGGLRSLLENTAKNAQTTPQVTLSASRPGGARAARSSQAADPLSRFGFPLDISRLPGPALTRAWSSGVLRVPASFDVVHSASLAVPRSGRVRTIVTLHDLAWRQVPFAYPRHGRRWHERTFVWAMQSRREFVVPSAEVAGQLCEAGVDSTLVNVIEPGGDHLPEPDVVGADLLLERLGVRGTFILSVGTLEPRKNLAKLALAHEKARPSLPEGCPLVVVGPQGWGRGVEPRDGVVLAGPVSDGVLEALYRRALLLAYVPLLEGFGLPPLEAMNSGTPVLASRIPSAREAAFVVDPTNVDEMADGLIEVATDESLRGELVEAGRARASLLTWQRCASKHVELWDARAPRLLAG